nr:hypothetical protein [Tanacetum cinerariifolium]
MKGQDGTLAVTILTHNDHSMYMLQTGANIGKQRTMHKSQYDVSRDSRDLNLDWKLPDELSLMELDMTNTMSSSVVKKLRCKKQMHTSPLSSVWWKSTLLSDTRSANQKANIDEPEWQHQDVVRDHLYCGEADAS